MRWFAGVIGLLALWIVLQPDLGAQDAKDPASAGAKEGEKKDPDKKDADNADAKKDDSKSKKKEAKKEPEEKVVYGQFMTGKLKRLDANSGRDFTMEVSRPDPVKVNALNVWAANEMNRIMTQVQPKQRAQQMQQYQMQLDRKQSTEIYSPKNIDLHATDNCKVRSNFPPVEYDDKGRPKAWKQKDLAKLKGNSKLPGYPADFDRLNVGQIVTAYLAKLKKGDAAAAKKKSADDDDQSKPDVVMILIVNEAPEPK